MNDAILRYHVNTALTAYTSNLYAAGSTASEVADTLAVFILNALRHESNDNAAISTLSHAASALLSHLAA